MQKCNRYVRLELAPAARTRAGLAFEAERRQRVTFDQRTAPNHDTSVDERKRGLYQQRMRTPRTFWTFCNASSACEQDSQGQPCTRSKDAGSTEKQYLYQQRQRSRQQCVRVKPWAGVTGTKNGHPTTTGACARCCSLNRIVTVEECPLGGDTMLSRGGLIPKNDEAMIALKSRSAARHADPGR